MKKRSTPWLLLFARSALFLAVQALFALGFWVAGSTTAWEDGANWWPISVAIADLLCLIVLIVIFRAEGRRYWDLFRIDRQHIKGDLLALLIVTVLAAPLSFLPNVWLGAAFFGRSDATLALIVRPLPLLAVYIAMVAFPLMQGLTEVGTYFGTIMPRLKAQGVRPWLAIGIPAVMLSLQHVFAPLLFDVRFIAWRGLMFLPFALMTGVAFSLRPRLLPYFAVIHTLMNVSFVAMFLSAAY